jgi:hypothetical protein
MQQWRRRKKQCFHTLFSFFFSFILSFPFRPLFPLSSLFLRTFFLPLQLLCFNMFYTLLPIHHFPSPTFSLFPSLFFSSSLPPSLLPFLLLFLLIHHVRFFLLLLHLLLFLHPHVHVFLLLRLLCFFFSFSSPSMYILFLFHFSFSPYSEIFQSAQLRMRGLKWL